MDIGRCGQKNIEPASPERLPLSNGAKTSFGVDNHVGIVLPAARRQHFSCEKNLLLHGF
jgi:hypothetical protein